MHKKQRKGLISELIAYAYLAKNPDIIVFKPIGGVGPIDIVTYNIKTKEYINYDVKTVSIRKKQTHRCKAGSRINRTPSKRQKELNVKIIYVTEQGDVYEVRRRSDKN